MSATPDPSSPAPPTSSARKWIGAAAIAGSVVVGGAIGALVGTPILSGAQESGTTAPTTQVAPTTDQTAPVVPDQNAPAPGNQQAPRARNGQGRPQGPPPSGTFDKTKGGHVGPNGTAEQLLTGDQATRATAAAQAAVPGGTIDRVETDAEGAAFEAHVTKSDGSEVTVKMDANFTVTSVEDGPA